MLHYNSNKEAHFNDVKADEDELSHERESTSASLDSSMFGNQRNTVHTQSAILSKVQMTQRKNLEQIERILK